MILNQAQDDKSTRVSKRASWHPEIISSESTSHLTRLAAFCDRDVLPIAFARVLEQWTDQNI
ncbi:MAG: hypothetical protein J4N63_09355, partial [Chloroflexi bacterium]|nr:hypothetical protein [Chloroflexota bacterium]